MDKISYRFKKSKRAKRMRLTVYRDGTVVMTSPFGVHQSIIEKFISDKAQWVLGKIKLFSNTENKVVQTFSRKDYLKHKDRARILVEDRIEYFSRIHKFSFNKISIRDQKTRWGSCSSKKNLSINYKVLFLSEEQRDYVIVHELCHLKEFNHSHKFWSLVAEIVPDYLEIKKELKKSGLFHG